MFQVTPIPAFQDNYIWAIQCADRRQVAVVDPGDAEPVLHYLNENGLELAAILITHHHPDHTGGVGTLLNKTEVPVYGPANSPFKGITRPLNSGDQITLFGKTLSVQATPGHTLDHICYYLDGSQPQLFCGDTLFLAGCGRLFEGTPEQMLNSMAYFRTLPPQTAVYCTHEYSLANLKFAVAVEPENPDIHRAIEQCSKQRQQGLPTLPSNLEQEQRINPFMRTEEPTVIKAAEQFSKQQELDAIEVFSAIREWKNVF